MAHIEEVDYFLTGVLNSVIFMFPSFLLTLTEFTDNLLASQAFIFFVAGFETSSSAMSFCLHELSVNPEIQERLRKEIDSTLEKCKGNITYDAIQNMSYIDQVLAGEYLDFIQSHVFGTNSIYNNNAKIELCKFVPCNVVYYRYCNRLQHKFLM
jgi:hypothetical protein